MSIASRQVKKEVNRIIEERMKEGYVPTMEHIVSQLSKFYKMISVGMPSFKLRTQNYRKAWDIDKYNDNLKELSNDLNNLYEELVDQFTIILEDFDYYDTERQKLMHEIKKLEGNLDDLLLVAEDTEGYLYSFHDSFIDRSNINLEYSTCEVNTDAGIVTLRESRQGIKKLDMSHYFDVVNYPILADEEYADNIISNHLMLDSKFGYAFSDINTSWAQSIISTKGGALVVSFIVDLTPKLDMGTYISRIEMRGQSSNHMKVEPLWSLDNINFKRLPIGYGVGNKLVTDNKKTIWNFEELRAKYLKFVVTKDIEDQMAASENISTYLYTVGFKNIEILEMAYNKTSTLYSNVFTMEDPTGEESTIDKAVLITEEDIQPETKIDYYLSLGEEGEDDPTEYNWVSVSPVNSQEPTEQQLVDFRHVSFFTNVPDIQWDESSYGATLESYKGVDFYKVYEFPYEPVRDSVEIYRGKNNWQVTPKYDVKRVAIYNEEHSFDIGSTITLTYPTSAAIDGEGLIRGSIVVKSEPGENPGYVYVNSSDYEVSYSTKIITKTTGSNISDDPQSPSNTVYVDYKYDDEESEPTEYTTYIYILNSDGLDINITPFTVAEQDAGNFTTITTTEGIIDLSSETFFHIPPGWHKVVTTAEPREDNDRFYSVNDDKYLYQKVYRQFAYAEKLQEVSWFELKNNTLKSNHSRFCVIDYDGDSNKEIVVNYKPQTSLWSSSSDDMLCPDGAETYVLSYKYISTQTNDIYLKAVLSRNDDSSPITTPTLNSYTIKLGY